LDQVKRLLRESLITTEIAGQYLPLETEADEVTICVHSDTPVSIHVQIVYIGAKFALEGAVDIAKLVRKLVDEHNLTF